MASGFSGAGVYRVDAAAGAFVLKIAGEPLVSWRLEILVQAARAGVAPRLVHVDEARGAIVSELVEDRSFAAFYMRDRDAALELLGHTLQRVHVLPIPPGARPADPDAFLAPFESSLPALATAALARVREERVVSETRVLSHNDLNPTNLVFDGKGVLLLDWNTAAPNDPLYDLATIAVFMRMDDAACARLCTAYGLAEVPARLPALRRRVAALCGAIFLRLSGLHEGDESIRLVDVYQQLRTGALNIATPQGRWAFGVALVNESQ